MNNPRNNQEWTKGRLKHWLTDTIEQIGHFPNIEEMRATEGPGEDARQRFGNKAGMATLVGVDPLTVRHIYAEDTLIRSFQSWATNVGEDTALTRSNAEHAYTEKSLVANPQTYNRHFGEWDDVLERCGYVGRPDAVTCVSFARRLKQQYPDTPIRSAVAQHARKGWTPMLGDLTHYYPDLRQLVRWRVRWEAWSTSRQFRGEGMQCYLGYGLLALTRGGRVDNIRTEMNELAVQGVGPNWNEVPTQRMSGIPDDSRSQVWFMDKIVELQEKVSSIRDSTAMSTALQAVHVSFVPELNEAGAGLSI